MRRKATSKRFESIAEVQAALGAHRGGMSDKLETDRPIPDGVVGFTYQGLFDHADAELTGIRQMLIRSEDVHVRNLVHSAQFRRQSRTLADALYKKQTAARQVLAGVYGSEHDFEVAAISGRTPREPMVLAEQVDQTIKMLRQPSDLLPPRQVNAAIDFEALASELEADRRAFLKMRARYDRVRKASDGSRVELAKRLKEADRVFLWIARTLEWLFKMVDEQELADRIRTSARRLTRKQAEPDEAESDAEPSSETDQPADGDEAPSAPPQADPQPVAA